MRTGLLKEEGRRDISLVTAEVTPLPTKRTTSLLAFPVMRAPVPSAII